MVLYRHTEKNHTICIQVLRMRNENADMLL